MIGRKLLRRPFSDFKPFHYFQLTFRYGIHPGAVFSFDISSQIFSTSKSLMKNRAAKKGVRKAKAVEGILSPPKPPPSANGETDLIAAMEAMGPLVENPGAEEVKRPVDLLGWASNVEGATRCLPPR